MSSALELLREQGWLQMLAHGLSRIGRRWRDSTIAARIGAPGFRAGAAPRLLGLGRVRLGEDFHAGDALWLEAVLHYAGATFTPELTIGPHARLSDSVHIGCLRRITIGAHLLSGSGVLITDHAHGCYTGAPASDPAVPPAQRPLHAAAEVRIGNNVWLGDGVAVLPGADIGDGCVIGANSVVTGTIMAGTLAVGSPARPVRRWNAAQKSWLPCASESPSGIVTAEAQPGTSGSPGSSGLID